MSKMDKVLGVILFVVLGSVWSGLVLSQLWAWFIVGQFHLPQIGIAEAIGLSMIVSYLTKDFRINEEDQKRALWKTMLIAFLWPAFTLFFAWIVHMFVTFPAA